MKPTKENDVTEEEITQLIEQGVYSGAVDQIEQDLVEQIFYLGDKRLGDILTPRTQLTWLDIEDTMEINLQKMNESHHSRFPVGKGSLDHFQGIIHTKDVFAKLVKGESFRIEDCIEETLILPEPMKVYHALETLKQSGHHEAMVIDEYGGIEGFVTLHDIMENIIGDMPEEEDEKEPQIIERDESSWLVDGLVTIDTFKRYFEIENIPLDNNYHTIGGFITSHIGDVPKEKDTVHVDNYLLEVVDMDHVRVDKVLITKIEEEQAD